MSDSPEAKAALDELEHAANALERYQPLTVSVEAAIHDLVNRLKAAEADNERLRETIKQWEATAAAQSSAIERLRQRQPCDLDERDRTFSHVMPAMDAVRKTHGLRERLGE